MNAKDIVRVFVRLQGFMLLFYGMIELTYLPGYIRAFTALEKPSIFASSVEVQQLGTAVLRIALQFLLGAVLIARCDVVIDRLLVRGIRAKEGDHANTRF
jgi:hypothetical protein